MQAMEHTDTRNVAVGKAGVTTSAPVSDQSDNAIPGCEAEGVSPAGVRELRALLLIL